MSSEVENCTVLQTNNFYYWLYKITRFNIEKEKEEGIDTEHKDYLWNRWMINILVKPGSKDYHKSIHELQKVIDETTPSFVKKPIRLADIKGLNEQEEKELLESIYEISNNNSNIVPTNKENNSIIDFTDIKEWREVVTFDHFLFPLEANFKESIFIDNAHFRYCLFLGKVLFDKTEFHKNAYFTASRFSETVSFLKAKFATDNNIDVATYSNKPSKQYNYEARFIEVTFLKKTSFFNAEFHGSVLFSGSAFFGDINRFLGARFSKSPFFYGTIFNNPCNLANCNLDTLPNFTGCEFRAGLDITGIEFKDQGGWKKHQYLDKETKKETYSLRNDSNVKGGGPICELLIERQEDMITESPDKKIDYKAARHSLQLLRETAKKNDDTQSELKYMKWEFDIALKDKKEPCVFKFFLKCYKCLSNYGTSILRPFFIFLLQFALLGLLYSSLSLNSEESSSINSEEPSSINSEEPSSIAEPSPFHYSFINSIVFIPIVHIGYYQDLFNNTFGEQGEVTTGGPNKAKTGEQDKVTAGKPDTTQPDNKTCDDFLSYLRKALSLISETLVVPQIDDRTCAVYLSYSQKFLSLILLFLFTLAIRNRLKLR